MYGCFPFILPVSAYRMCLRDDRLYYIMGKNDKTVSLKIPAKALSIINEYKETAQKDGFIFPELKKADTSNANDVYKKTKTAVRKFNRILKELAELAEIDKPLTNHIARYTFGSMSGDKISIQTLQKLYRHTNISTTIGYQSNFMNKTADDALELVVRK